jgi:hypothetical protein
MTTDTLTEQPPSPPAQDSDYDGAWKEALRRFLREILERYFPAVAGAIAWEHPPVWSDKELSQILGQTGRRNRTVDLLVKVWLRDGGEQWILLHLEIQAFYEEDFAQWLALYNSGLCWIYKQRVVTLAVLADLREGWLPDEDRFQLADFETRTRFPVCKLIDRLRSDWQDDHSLPVQLARAQIAALRTAGDPEGRYQAKWQLVRKLYELGYTADQVRELFGLIDWMMHLRVDLEQRFKQELDEFEESRQMPYVTSVERISRAEGAATVLLKLLTKRWGSLSEELQQQIRHLPLDQLGALGEAVLDFGSRQDLEAWLEAQSATTTDH